MNRQVRWAFNVNDELSGEINLIRNQYIQVMGREPSKTDLINLLLKNFKERRFKQKNKRKNEICFY